MVAVKSMPMGGMPAPMGPPMGGQMGPPPAAPVQMPNMAPPSPPPMPGQVFPQQQQQQQSVGSVYGGSAVGRANLKNYMAGRKQQFMASQQLQQQRQMPVPPVAPMSFGQRGGLPMGSMGPMPIQGGSMMGPMVGPGRVIGDNASVGSAQVQMMGGGVVPLFRGLGRY